MADVWADILLDENRDLKIANGDFAIGDSTEQDVELILIHTQGSWRATPLLGVGVFAWPNRRYTDIAVSMREIKLQLQADGMKNVSVTVVNEEHRVRAER